MWDAVDAYQLYADELKRLTGQDAVPWLLLTWEEQERFEDEAFEINCKNRGAYA